MLDEMLKALEESFRGLTDEQLWFDGIETRNRIGSILMHVQENVDQHACYFQTGSLALEHDPRFDFYGKPALVFAREEELPTADEILGRHQRLRKVATAGLEGVGDEELMTARASEREYWWTQHQRKSIDAYHRVVWHANAHIRQIWLIRGHMGWFGPDVFPAQFYH